MPPCSSRSRMTNLPTVVPVKSGESRATGFDCIRGSAIEVADRRARRLPLALQHDEGGWSRKRFSWVPDPLSGILLLVRGGSNAASGEVEAQFDFRRLANRNDAIVKRSTLALTATANNVQPGQL